MNKVSDGKGNIISWGAIAALKRASPPSSPASSRSSTPTSMVDEASWHPLNKIVITKKDLMTVYYKHLFALKKGDDIPSVVNFFLTLSGRYVRDTEEIDERDKQLLVDFINSSVTLQSIEEFIDKVGLRSLIKPPLSYFRGE